MKNTRKILALVLALILAVSLSVSAFAVGNDGTVTVYITVGNFNTDGDYIGATPPDVGTANDNFDIFALVLNIDDIQTAVDDGQKEYYLPDPSDDPLDGEASVLDAIISAFLDNNVAPSDITAGWDSAPVVGAPGGYISNVAPQELDTYPPEVVGNNTIYSGTGWLGAYTQSGVIAGTDVYLSTIPLADGMDIVFDVSTYSILWPNS
jgi:hypothetical protein